MFSAVYLVCIMGQPCQFFVDAIIYPTEEVCIEEAEATIVRNSNLPNVLPFTAEYQCVSWEKA